MLEISIIQPNNSPYSSLIILAKKKDRSWQFFVDDWAILLDEFTILVIEELLNELNGVFVFF